MKHHVQSIIAYVNGRSSVGYVTNGRQFESKVCLRLVVFPFSKVRLEHCQIFRDERDFYRPDLL